MRRRKQDVDRILADDGRERAGRLVDEIADRHIGQPMRPSIGALISVKARLILACSSGGLCGAHVSSRRALIRHVLIDRRLRNRVRLDQLLGSLQRERRVPLRRLGAGQRGVAWSTAA